MRVFIRIFATVILLSGNLGRRVMILETSQFLLVSNVSNQTGKWPHIIQIQTAVVVTVVLARTTTGG